MFNPGKYTVKKSRCYFTWVCKITTTKTEFHFIVLHFPWIIWYLYSFFIDENGRKRCRRKWWREKKCVWWKYEQSNYSINSQSVHQPAEPSNWLNLNRVARVSTIARPKIKVPCLFITIIYCLLSFLHFCISVLACVNND